MNGKMETPVKRSKSSKKSRYTSDYDVSKNYFVDKIRLPKSTKFAFKLLER